MLGADAATELSDIVHDAVVHRQVVRSDAGHVDVDVAIPGVAEQPRRRLRVGAADDVGHIVDEGGQDRRRQRHVELVGRTERVDRLGVTPRGTATAAPVGTVSVATATSSTAAIEWMTAAMAGMGSCCAAASAKR